MEWTVWDKLIVYYDEELGEISHGLLIYHFQNKKEQFEKTIPWYDVELIKNRLAVHKKIGVGQLQRYSYLEYRNLEDEILKEEVSLKEETKDNRTKKEYLQKHAVVNNVGINNRTIKEFLKNKFHLSTIIARTFVGYKEKDVMKWESSLFSFNKGNGKLDDVSKIIMRDYPKAENIIYHLVVENYDALNDEDINFIKDYFEWISRINNTSFDEDFTFSVASFLSKGLYKSQEDILKKVETLYNNIHIKDNLSDAYRYSEENAIKYLLYVMTLVSGGENTNLYEEDKKEEVSNFNDAFEFNRMSDIAKLYILSQIKDVVINNQIDFNKLGYHIYSFNTDDSYKKTFIDSIDKRINKLVLDMRTKINDKKRKK